MDDIRDSLFEVESVELWWYQKLQQPFEHIGLVLLLDHIPIYTIDFGTEDGTIKFVKVPGGKKGGVHINLYQKEFKLKGYLTTFDKSEVIGFVNKCLQYTSTYNLLSHNCRDFVIVAVSQLFKQGKITENTNNDFQKNVFDVTSQDDSKLVRYLSFSIVGVLVFVITKQPYLLLFAESVEFHCLKCISIVSSNPDVILNIIAVILTTIAVVLTIIVFSLGLFQINNLGPKRKVIPDKNYAFIFNCAVGALVVVVGIQIARDQLQETCRLQYNFFAAAWMVFTSLMLCYALLIWVYLCRSGTNRG